MLGTPKEEIEKALTVRVVAAKRDVVKVKTKVDKAVYARDALAKVTTRSLHLLATSFADRTLALSCCPFLYRCPLIGVYNYYDTLIIKPLLYSVMIASSVNAILRLL